MSRLDPHTELSLERKDGRCRCYQGNRQVRAERTLKSAAEFAARLPPIAESAEQLLRMIALHPDMLRREFNGTHLAYVVWANTRYVTADYQELRIRGLVIAGKLTKAGVNAI